MLQSLVALAFPFPQLYWNIAVETFPVVSCLSFFSDKTTSFKDIQEIIDPPRFGLSIFIEIINFKCRYFFLDNSLEKDRA